MNELSYERLRKDLRGLLREPVWPSGSRLVAFDPIHQAEPVHQLLAEAYATGGGHVGAFVTWWTSIRVDPEYDPSLILLAVDHEDSIVGVAFCWTSGFLKDLAVAVPWRRRGLGEALLRHAFLVFRTRGAEHLDLKVECDNPSGAGRLYRRLGMRLVEQAEASAGSASAAAGGA